MRKLTMAVLASITAAFAVTSGTTVAQETKAEAGKRYTVDSTLVGTLLDDPAAAAILQKLIPNVYGNEMFKSMGRDQTLKSIQQYEPVDLNNDNLAKIQAEFDKLAAKK